MQLTLRVLFHFDHQVSFLGFRQRRALGALQLSIPWQDLGQKVLHQLYPAVGQEMARRTLSERKLAWSRSAQPFLPRGLFDRRREEFALHHWQSRQQVPWWIM